jgi:protein-L-isoaspartate(D-aspartate) O-methyltransferase
MVSKITLLIVFFLTGVLYGENNKIDYSQQRRQMVEEQIFHRGITDKRVLNAFSRVKRHLFVKAELRDKAYGDFTLDIGQDQEVSPPYMVAVMTYAIAPNHNKKVLEIGTGSGYHAAVLAELTKYVYTIELLEPLAKKAKKLLDSMGYKNIKFKIGDGYEGWEEYAPYDGIIVTCSEDHIPQPLINQLAVGGRLIIPVRYAFNMQELILLEKDSKGQLKKTHLIPVQVVPLIRGSKKND